MAAGLRMSTFPLCWVSIAMKWLWEAPKYRNSWELTDGARVNKVLSSSVMAKKTKAVMIKGGQGLMLRSREWQKKNAKKERLMFLKSQWKKTSRA